MALNAYKKLLPSLKNPAKDAISALKLQTKGLAGDAAKNAVKNAKSGIASVKNLAGGALPAVQKLAGDPRITDKVKGIVSPRDAASGLPTGKRMHKPF